MKKLLLFATCLAVLCGCSKGAVEDVQATKAQSEKIPLTITLYISFDPQWPLEGGGNLTPTINVKGNARKGDISFNLRNVYRWINWQFTPEDPFSIETYIVGDDNICLPTMPMSAGENTYLDLNSVKYIPSPGSAADFDITWVVKGVPAYGTPMCTCHPGCTCERDKCPCNYGGTCRCGCVPYVPYNELDLEWNGNSWDIVARYPVASDLIISCDSPNGTESWTFPQGTTRMTISNSDPMLQFTGVDPSKDASYEYIYYN